MNDIERRTLLGAAGIGAIAALSKAGPLNPPAGTVAGTGRTLDEVYNKIPGANGSGDGRIPIAASSIPVTIGAPGSYVLAGNIAVSTSNGITINASNVTLDLNGFTVSSTATTGNGVSTGGSLSRIVVRNGTITGFNNGVFTGSNANGVLLEDLLIKDAKTTGINISNSGNPTNIVLRRCHVFDTGSTTTAADVGLAIVGIAMGGYCQRVEECTVVRLLYNGAGIATRRGIFFTVFDTASNLVSRCFVGNDTAISGNGIVFPATGQGVYRDNTVFNFSTSYISGTNGGGNI